MGLVVARALIAGKAPAEAVLGGDGALERVADVVAGDGAAVVEDVAGVDGEDPVGGGVVGSALVEHVGDDVEVVVQLDHVLVDEVAHELVGVVGREDGVGRRPLRG